MVLERVQPWLRLASAASIGFGVVIALGACSVPKGPVAILADLFLWPPRRLPVRTA